MHYISNICKNIHINKKNINRMLYENYLKSDDIPLLRIHIDDISSIKAIKIASLTTDSLLFPTSLNRMQMLLYQLLMGFMKGRIENESMHIIMPMGVLRLSDDINLIISISKAIIEDGDVDSLPHEDGEATDIYYDTASSRLYWDASHTNQAVMLNMVAKPSSVENAMREKIAQAFGDSVIFNDNSLMLIDAHGEYESAMGRITRICDMLSYETLSSPDIYNDKRRYFSKEKECYISITKMNP